MIFLYIKQCKCGLKYFGATTQSDPFKYPGSGKDWQEHIKQCGKKYIRTVDIYGFDDRAVCKEFALSFSKQNQIVESSQWANKIYEDGQTGTWPSTWGPRIGWKPICKGKTWNECYGEEKALVMRKRASQTRKGKVPRSPTLWKVGEKQSWNTVNRIHITNGVENKTLRGCTEKDIPTGWRRGTTRTSTGIAQEILTPHGRFKSIAEAARQLSVSQYTISKRIESHQHTEWKKI